MSVPDAIARQRPLRFAPVSDRHKVTLNVKIDGARVSSETTCMWAGPYVFVVATALSDPDLAVDVHSSFIGHRGVLTLASHLILGPVGHEPYAVSAEHEHANIDPALRPRECVYEHAGIVVEALKAVDRDAGIDVPDDAFAEIDDGE
jgi:hypothetical protein